MEDPVSDDVVQQVFQFDGQTVWASRGSPLLEVGNFLGGGAAGTVYECEHSITHEHFALKILNPLGFKLVAPALLRKCVILYKGEIVTSSERDKEVLAKENVWWLLDGSTKQHIAAYYSERQNCLKDLSLNQCIQIWGSNPPGVSEDSDGHATDPTEELVDASTGAPVLVPRIPPKYADFVRRRDRIFREIKNMRKISNHINVIRLESVLELTQESKCTVFLVMELANGGELFDRIKIDCGTRESTAKVFFQQLLEGVEHCHAQGVCHRDLKPENLLLQDGASQAEGTTLKIADFGFSARFALEGSSHGSESKDANNYKDQQVMHTGITPVAPPAFLEDYSPLRMLKSVVGSPFYVAPEVLQARGYDGPRADIWSLGVILYAMLAGNLPFGQELGTCKRFRHFCKWVREQQQRNERFWEEAGLEYPPWLFPAKFSVLAKGLIVSMLHPEPASRINIAEAMKHPLCFRETPATLPKPAPLSQAFHPQKTPVSKQQAEQDEGIDSIVELTAVASAMSIAQNEEGGEDDDEDDDNGFFRMEEEDESESGGSDHGKRAAFAAKEVKWEEASSAPAALVSSSYEASSQFGAVRSPPPAPVLVDANIDDLVIGDDEDINKAEQPRAAAAGRAQQVPAFSDLVKRSTRFLTMVPAVDVLIKVERLLEECKASRLQTPVGFIGKVMVNWDNFHLDVWGHDTLGPPMCALQLYQLPADTNIISASPSPNVFIASSFDGRDSLAGQPVSRPVFLVEFIRGELEIFIFKRFYQWVREKISEVVKRDWAGSNYLDHMSPSPRLDNSLLNRYQGNF